MKSMKNNLGFQRNVAAIIIVVAFVFLGIAVLYLMNNSLGDDPITGNGELNPDQVENGSQVNELSETQASKIIEDLLRQEGGDDLPEINIDMAYDDHIKAELFYGPGGSILLAAKLGAKWKKISEGNGIPTCSDISPYGFPAEMVPACMDEYRDEHIKNDWSAIKNAIANCRVESIMQTHSLYVSAELENGEKLEGFEPTIDEIIHLAVDAQDDCGEIIMATE